MSFIPWRKKANWTLCPRNAVQSVHDWATAAAAESGNKVCQPLCCPLITCHVVDCLLNCITDCSAHHLTCRWAKSILVLNMDVWTSQCRYDLQLLSFTGIIFEHLLRNLPMGSVTALLSWSMSLYSAWNTCDRGEMDFSFPCRRPPGNFLYFRNPDEKLLITWVCGRQLGRWH